MVFRRTVTRAENPYPTIIPPLVALAELLQPTRILEFGAGQVSTPLFLDRKIFPQVEQLVTCENDPAWIDRITESLTDQRVTIVSRPVPMVVIANQIDITPFDLILIDDSFTWTERAQTIQSVMARRSRKSVVVIHDYDVPLYRDVARNGPGYEYIFSAFTPHTGVLWDEGHLIKKQLRTVDRLLFTYRSEIDLNQADTILSILQSSLSHE